MNFIKRIFDGKIDEFIHQQFQKFSKGEFGNRALIKAKNSSGKYSINTTQEFANELVRYLAEKLENNKTKITGVIVSTSNLKEEPEFRNILAHCEVKQFMGIKQFKINDEMSGKSLIYLLDKFPKAFFALSFKVGEDELKIKPKAPKSAKPSTKTDEKINPDFCKLKTKDKKVAESFVFEKPDFKLAEISHTFLITDLIMPKGETDFAKIREMSKRKGKIVRNAEIDGQKIVKEKEFEA